MAGRSKDGWMITFSDMTTLLLTFFVLLLSMSSLKNAKIKQLLSSFNKYGFSILEFDWQSQIRSGFKFEPIPGMIFIPSGGMAGTGLHENLESYVQETGLESQIEIERELEMLKITITDQVLFQPAKAELRDENKRILREIGKIIKEVGVPIRIEGHTDNLPISTDRFPSNWELSAARALSVLHFFQEDVVIKPWMLSAAGYGEYKPIADNGTPEGRTLNRRVEIHLIGAFEKNDH